MRTLLNPKRSSRVVRFDLRHSVWCENASAVSLCDIATLLFFPSSFFFFTLKSVPTPPSWDAYFFFFFSLRVVRSAARKKRRQVIASRTMLARYRMETRKRLWKSNRITLFFWDLIKYSSLWRLVEEPSFSPFAFPSRMKKKKKVTSIWRGECNYPRISARWFFIKYLDYRISRFTHLSNGKRMLRWISFLIDNDRRSIY